MRNSPWALNAPLALQVVLTMTKGQKKTGKGRLDKYYKLAK